MVKSNASAAYEIIFISAPLPLHDAISNRMIDLIKYWLNSDSIFLFIPLHIRFGAFIIVCIVTFGADAKYLNADYPYFDYFLG